jgi:transcription elongation factor Elf1
MLTCPRCGSEAQYLADDTDDTYCLLRCEFCGEDIDAADLALRATVDRIAQGLLPASSDELLPPREAELA